MPTSYFVDSWYFIALVNPLDPHHLAAKRLERTFGSRAFVTHDAVFVEVLNFFSEYGSVLRHRVAQTVRRAAVECEAVVAADRTLFVRALDLYERRLDKGYSLTDCMSMVVIRDRDITHVLTNDHHFRQEGFTVLADAP